MSAESSEVFAPTSLSDIFSGKAPETAAPVTTEAPKDDKPAASTKDTSAASPSEVQAEVKPKDEQPEGKPQRERDEHGRFTKTDEEIKALRTAMQEERRKRQDLESRLAKQSQQPPPKKDFFEDPEGALNERDAKLRTEADERFFKLTERAAKSRHDDYDEVVSAFFEDAKDDPALAQQIYSQVRSADDPAQFLYNTAKIRAEMKAVGGDLAKYREGVEAPLKSQLAEKDVKIKELETQLANLGKLSTSLNTEQSSTRAQVEADLAATPTPLEDIFPKQKRRRA
jgi:septal ring factor EnvC (AmiA/AmiB activator)